MAVGHLLDANTVALWRFDSASPYVPDVGPVGLYNLSPYNGAAVVPGHIDGAADLQDTKFLSGSGVGAGVSSPLHSAIMGSCTVEGWIKPAAVLSGTNFFFYYGNDWWSGLCCVYQPTHFLTFLHYDQATVGWKGWISSPAESVPLGVWTHFALTKTLANGFLDTAVYINGEQVATDSGRLVPVVDNSARTLHIGRISYNGGYSSVYVDDMRISNKVRTAEEIAISYFGPPAAVASRRNLDSPHWLSARIFYPRGPFRTGYSGGTRKIF